MHSLIPMPGTDSLVSECTEYSTLGARHQHSAVHRSMACSARGFTRAAKPANGARDVRTCDHTDYYQTVPHQRGGGRCLSRLTAPITRLAEMRGGLISRDTGFP